MTTGELLQREGALFLRRGKDQQCAASFYQPAVAIHDQYINSHNDAGPIEAAQERTLGDFELLAAAHGAISAVPSIQRDGLARYLRNLPLRSMMREAVNYLLI